MKKVYFIIMLFITCTSSSFAMSEKLDFATPCADQWVIDMDVLQGNYPGSEMDLDFNDAMAIADELFEKCLNDTY